MTRYISPNRMALPPTSATDDGRFVPSWLKPRRKLPAMLEPTLAGGIAIILAVTLIVAAPPTVTVPIALALGFGLGSSALVVAGGRWLTRRRGAEGRSRHQRGEPLGLAHAS